jgi:hypothetical protein
MRMRRDFRSVRAAFLAYAVACVASLAATPTFSQSGHSKTKAVTYGINGGALSGSAGAGGGASSGSSGVGAASGGGQGRLLEATKQMQETPMGFNLQNMQSPSQPKKSKFKRTR